MRFHNSDSQELINETLHKYDFLDFDIFQHLKFDSSFDTRKEKLDAYNKNNNIIHRIKNLLNYFIPYRNLKSYMTQKSKYKVYNFDVYANTIYQDKI